MSKKTITTVMGAAIATTLAGVANAGGNPFALNDLSGGYQQVAEAGADAAKDKKEMVCGEGKCGGKMTKSPEMNCGAMKEQAQKQAEQQQKAMEGKCAGMKMDSSAPVAPAAPAAPEAPKQ